MTRNVLVTGHAGYIGTVLVPLLRGRGYQVTGLDTGLFDGHEPYRSLETVPALDRDIRDVGPEDLAGFNAVIHLAAISNDPVGDLSPEITDHVNHRATGQLARAAKAAGVGRFLFSSSCSLYGAAEGDRLVEESAAFNPVTPYGEAKVRAEQSLAALADENFSPTFLRNATAYGLSPRLRADLVVNNLVGVAHATGHIRLQSDGSPWRPLVHVEDIAGAFLAVLEAPRDRIHAQAFNVGRTEENYRIRDVAEIVRDAMPDCDITFAAEAGPDKRTYRVSFEKIRETLPAYQPRWTVAAGVRQLLEALDAAPLTLEEFLGPRFVRLKQVRALIEAGALDEELRWTSDRDRADQAGVS